MQSLLLSIGSVIAIFAFFAFVFWLSTRKWMSLGEGHERRERALRQFRAYAASSAADHATVHGKDSVIVAERESGAFEPGQVHSYSLTLLARTPSSQYFLFVANEDGKPYVKFLTPEAAARLKQSMKLVRNDA